MKLTYKQFKQIMLLTVQSGALKFNIEEMLSGEIKLSLGEILSGVLDSGADEKIIEIITGKNPDELSDQEGIKALVDFFGYIKSSLIPALVSQKNS